MISPTLHSIVMQVKSKKGAPRDEDWRRADATSRNGWLAKPTIFRIFSLSYLTVRPVRP